MLALVLIHAIVTELLIFNSFPLLWLFKWGRGNSASFIFLTICYGHILTILALVIHAVLSKTDKFVFYLAMFFFTIIGCFFHLWIMIFTLHNPSKYEMNVLIISLIVIYLLAIFLFVKVLRILKNINSE